MKQRLQVDAGGEDQTLLSFLRAHLEEYPSVKAIKRAIDQKLCKINGRVESFSTHPVKKNDQIEICLELFQKPAEPKILYEDEELIIFHKPPRKVSESFEGLYLVHRLDKDTSGTILYAKNAKIQDPLIDLFRKREIEKEYLAICDKRVSQDAWKVDNFLGRKASYQGGSIYGKVQRGRGKHAISHFQCLKRGETASLIRAIPITGRTHQVRVHLKGSGYPVLGDWQYHRDFTCTYHPPRQLLHAYRLKFRHPATGEEINCEAKLPEDFQEAEKHLL